MGRQTLINRRCCYMDCTNTQIKNKECKDCNVNKLYTSEFFVKDNRSTTGLTNQCKDCRKKAYAIKARTKGIEKRKKFTFKDVKDYVLEINESFLLTDIPDSVFVKTIDYFEFQCKCGEIFERRFNKFKDAKQHKCSDCANAEGFDKQRKKHSEFIEELKELKGEEFEVLSEYLNYHSKIRIKHVVCGKQFDMPAIQIIYQNQGCPICKESKGEKAITEFLEAKRINYIKQFRTELCKNVRPLPFDFAIIKDDLTFLIEYDGIQHFEVSEFFGGQKTFIKRKYNDNLKNEFAKTDNIHLLRIPYWEFNNIENILEKELNTFGLLESAN